MGAAFEQWLAKRSSRPILRHILKYESQARTRRQFAIQHVRSQHTSTGIQLNRSAQAEGVLDGETSMLDGRWGITRPQSAEMAVRMSLKTGVVLLSDVGGGDTWEKLRVEMDVNNKERQGKLQVDQADNRHNMSLWLEILRFRHRVDGLEGIIDVWTGMRNRDIDLPVAGPEADELWTSILTASIAAGDEVKANNEHRMLALQFQQDIVAYARDLKARTGSYYTSLYNIFIGRWLRVNPVKSHPWHAALVTAGLVPPRALVGLVPEALTSRKAFRAIKRMYTESLERDLYDLCMEHVMTLGTDRDRYEWHNFFLSHRDGPGPMMMARTDIQRLFALDEDDASAPSRKASQRFRPIPRKDYVRKEISDVLLTRQSMNTIVGEVHGIKPKEISDRFCARLLATRAFSLDIVIQGLSFFGIEKLGSLALREMALRAETPIQFTNKLAVLKGLGITVTSTSYSRLVTKLAQDGNTRLWTTLLDSDQHPESYDDHDLQEQLLARFLGDRRINQAHLTLLLLSMNGSEANIRGWNRIIQHYTQHRQYRAMLDTMQGMQNEGTRLTLRSINLMYYNILPPRLVGKRYRKGSATSLFDPLLFCTNAFLYSSDRGTMVPPHIFVELLKRNGMDHRWDDLKRLVLWMARRFLSTDSSPPQSGYVQLSRGRRRRSGEFDALRDTWTPNLTKAIFVWGFRYAAHQGRLQLLAGDQDGAKEHPEIQPWAFGLHLVRSLLEMGYVIDPLDIKNVFTLRMWILFGPAFSLRRLNNEARVRNRLTIRQYINHANEVWPGLVDWVDPHLLEHSETDDVLLLTQFFGAYRVTNLKTGEYADVRAWAEALSRHGNDYIHEPDRIIRKARRWGRSRFRLNLTRPLSAESKTDGITVTHLSPERRSPVARSESSHPPPSPLYIQEPP